MVKKNLFSTFFGNALIGLEDFNTLDTVSIWWLIWLVRLPGFCDCLKFWLIEWVWACCLAGAWRPGQSDWRNMPTLKKTWVYSVKFGQLLPSSAITNKDTWGSSGSTTTGLHVLLILSFFKFWLSSHYRTTISHLKLMHCHGNMLLLPESTDAT